MIKIFQIITSVQVGGAENVVFNLVEGCYNAHENKIIFLIFELFDTQNEYSVEKKKILKNKGIIVRKLSPFGKRLSLFIAPITLLFYLLTEKPNIIHSHTDLPDFILAVVLKFKKFNNKKIIRTIHNTNLWNEHKKVGNFVETSFTNDIIIGVSESALVAYKNLRLSYKLSISNNIYKIYNGCKLPNTSITDFKISGSRMNIAFCGRLVFQKGTDYLINIIDVLCNKFPNKFIFHIIGEGSMESEILLLTKRHQNVLFYGSIAQMSNKLWQFQFLLMPSRFEGLPLISIEAALSGVLIISSNSLGLVETLPSGWPFIFDMNNLETCIEIFNKILSNCFNLNELRNELYQYVSVSFSYEKMINEYTKIYLNDIPSLN